MTYTKSTEQFINRPREDVFEFFSRAENLERLTPDFLNFQVVSETPIEMKEGTEIEYSLSVHGLPMTWISRIECWEPPEKFVDVQIKGPYKRWHHTHKFETQNNGTLVKDHVEYDVPGWIFSSLINHYFVRPDVEDIFSYRQKQLQDIFPEEAP